MARNRGIEFERQFIASVPAGVRCTKLKTGAPPPDQMQRVEALLRGLPGGCPEWAAGIVRNARFTPKQPYDLELKVPLVSAGDVVPTHSFTPLLNPFHGSELNQHDRVRAHLCIAMEAKCAGDQLRLDFAAVDEHQEDGLLAAAADGLLAGLVVEFPTWRVPTDSLEALEGVAFFTPIRRWCAHREASTRKSAPIAWFFDNAYRIDRDYGRGRSKSYWNVGRWLYQLTGINFEPAVQRRATGPAAHPAGIASAR
jgi:hypothetical protein